MDLRSAILYFNKAQEIFRYIDVDQNTSVTDPTPLCYGQALSHIPTKFYQNLRALGCATMKQYIMDVDIFTKLGVYLAKYSDRNIVDFDLNY
uniref:Uncharacterized protein n=1 Tax=Romanomermis culicivorax TaxID=13658 RepID=A0A915JH21_ROMCU